MKRRGPATARPGDLSDRQQMEDLIRREVCRADRNGHELSLVVFDLGPGSGGGRHTSRAACRLVREAVRRARTTDVIGWFGDGQLCAVLPDTPAAGARVFAQSVSDLASLHMPRPKAVIYQYPGEAPSPTSEDRLGLESMVVRRLPELAGANDVNGVRRDGNRSRRLNGIRQLDRRGVANHDGNGHNGNGHNGNGHHRDGHNRKHNENGENGHPHFGHGTKSRMVPDNQRVALAFLSGVGTNGGARRTEPLAPLMVRRMPRWKRAVDVVGAAVGLVLLAPVMAAAAVAILLTSPGPVLFTQRRAGLGGRPFTIYKFRTMAADAEAKKASLRPLSEQDGPAFKLTRDPRVTPLGHLLRRTSVDELPQLWNVLKGDMSLVGPRPLPLDESDGCTNWQRHRLNVTPGLTCIWQVSGRSTVSFAQWVRMDMAYIRRRTLLHDLWILLKTVPAVLMRKGAW
jgi:lipopolysaccharide/colanic/teichoic acid biosynthesis glycosyltransferase